ncbi:acetylajmalan esterase-like [Apium graveolens]|uniref:acetylajmalan esterase-like n=1 Tax=Apium graveolens TaxID=4045 RepID=UPI003D7A7C4F
MTGSRVKAVMFIFLNIMRLLSMSHGALHLLQSTLFENCKFDKIFQLGDSYSDTGNLLIENPLDISGRLPYGITYNKSTGRHSDGLLMIDYIASAANLPLLNPYENRSANFTNGINFAVMGATTIPVQTLAMKNIFGASTNNSLDVQVRWMSRSLSNYYNSQADCRDKLKNSLFFMGGIGANDFLFAFSGGKTIQEVKNFLVPEIVQTIMNATREIIKLGARKIVIPGNIPLGCLPAYLTDFPANSSFDQNHCLKEYNEFSVYYNLQLRIGIVKLQLENPSVTIVYGNLYLAFERLFSRAGFDPNSLLKACCGSGGKYNFGLGTFCGSPGVAACTNPNEYISWDGLHLTQQAYMYMAHYLIATLPSLLRCSPT